jgi:hypothetical protein
MKSQKKDAPAKQYPFVKALPSGFCKSFPSPENLYSQRNHPFTVFPSCQPAFGMLSFAQEAAKPKPTMSTPNPLSPKQLDANRRNAQRSTGPRTFEGRQIVRANARTHGLTGQFVIMPHEDREACEKFLAAIIEDLAPQGAIQHDLAQAIAQDRWRLNRARAVEDNIFALGQVQHDLGFDAHPRLRNAYLQAQTWLNDAPSFNLLSLYEQRIHRNLMKNTQMLEELQAKARAAAQATREVLSGTPAEQTAALAPPDPNPAPAPTARHKTENGFVFSNGRRTTAATATEASDASETGPSIPNPPAPPPEIARRAA